MSGRIQTQQTRPTTDHIRGWLQRAVQRRPLSRDGATSFRAIHDHFCISSCHPKARRLHSRRVTLAGFTCSSPIAMPCRAALLPYLEAAGHGQPQRSHRKAEKLQAAQLLVVGQTEGEAHTSGSQSRHDGAWAGQRRQRGSDPAVGSGLQPDRALLHPSTDTCAGTGSVTLAIQVHPSLSA